VKRQRNTAQVMEQTRNTEVKIIEEEIGKLPEKEFRIMFVKMIKNLENKMEKMQESINKDNTQKGKLQANITDEHRCKNPQQTFSKKNSATHQKAHTP